MILIAACAAVGGLHSVRNTTLWSDRPKKRRSGYVPLTIRRSHSFVQSSLIVTRRYHQEGVVLWVDLAGLIRRDNLFWVRRAEGGRPHAMRSIDEDSWDLNFLPCRFQAAADAALFTLVIRRVNWGTLHKAVDAAHRLPP